MMGRIYVNGVGIVNIAGDAPTPEESAAISKFAEQKYADLPELLPTMRDRAVPIPAGMPETDETWSPESMRARSKADQIVWAMTFPRSTEGKLTALKRAEPNARFESAPDGRWIIHIGDEKYMLNKPGVSAQDVQDFVAEQVFQAPAILLGGMTGKAALGTIGRVAGTAIGAAAGSAARDITAGEQVDVFNAAVSGGVTGVFEAFGPAVVNLMRRTFQRNVVNGSLTEEGRRILANAGIDADSVDDAFIREFNIRVAQAENAVDAARIAEAQSLPTPVQLSRGDVTRAVQDQALESAAERGALGAGAAEQSAAFRAAQQAQLQANAQAIQARVGGAAKPRVAVPGAGMQAAQTNLRTQRDALKGATDAAYTAAKATNAAVTPETAPAIGQAVRESVADFARSAPRVVGLAQELGKLSQAPEGAAVSAVKLKALEGWRAAMSTFTRSADPIERKAAGNALRAYDDFLGNVIDDALLRGDASALEAFKTARGLRRELAQKFEANEIVAKLIDDHALAVDPNQALNTLFTANTLGAKRNTTEAVLKIKDLLGDRSPDWAALKEEAFMRLLASQERGNVRGADAARIFSGDKYATALTQALRNSREMMNALFTRDEIALMEQFGRVATLATNRVEGAVNRSNTETVRRMLDGLGFIGPFLRKALDFAVTAQDERMLRLALSQPIRAVELPAGVAGVAGAAASTPLRQDQELRRNVMRPGQ